MFNEKEIQALLDLLRGAPTTYGVAHGLHATVERLRQTQRAVAAGAVLTLLSSLEWDAILATRAAASSGQTPQPSGPQPPAGALAAPVVS